MAEITPQLPSNDALDAELDEFMRSPPEVNSYRTFRGFFSRVLQCLIRKKIDTRVSNALVYAGSALLLGLDRETQEGTTTGAAERYKYLLGQVTNMTPGQATLFMQQADLASKIRVLEAIVEQHKQEQPEIVIDVRPITPPEKRIARMTKEATRHERQLHERSFSRREITDDEFAF